MTARKAALSLALEDGTDLADKIDPRFVSLELTEAREAEADELQLTLHNADGLLAIPETGQVLTLALGWEVGADVETGLVEKGRFTVDEIELSGGGDVDTMQIRARSADLTGQLRQRRTKAWEGMTLGEILRQIAARHGREARIAAGLASLAVEPIEQEGKSDIAFVADLGRRYDAIATWKDGKLVFLPIGASATASGTPLDIITLTRRDGWAWRWSKADREDYDGASAQWQDKDAGKRRTVKLGGDNRRKLKRVYSSEAEARQAAKAAMSRAARKPFRFSYDLAIADPTLQPDMKVALDGWNEAIDGQQWLVESLRTVLNGTDGLSQKIELESA